MMGRRMVAAVVIASVAAGTAPAIAIATPAALTRAADRSVVAVHVAGTLRTGFAFGKPGVIIASTPVGEGVEVITARGVSAVGGTSGRDRDLAALDAPALHLVALRRSRARRLGAVTVGYVLGAPLGYEGDRIRLVRLPAVSSRDLGTTLVAGRLPRSFEGAPVVTAAGRLIGAVGSAGAARWTLESQRSLSALAASVSVPGGGGVSALYIGGGGAFLVLLVVLGALGVIRARRRRRAEALTPILVRPRPAANPEPPLAQPLVRRREPAAEAPDDFDIILKSGGEQ